MSHDHSEIILTCWFAAQEAFLIIINVENSYASEYYMHMFHASMSNVITHVSFLKLVGVVFAHEHQTLSSVSQVTNDV